MLCDFDLTKLTDKIHTSQLLESLERTISEKSFAECALETADIG
jgi:hypothetical protein